MCSPVIYVYSCSHRERVIYRCGSAPAGATQEEINQCMERELRARGHWTTTLSEPCHHCEEAMRVHRRDNRRRTRARPSFIDSSPAQPGRVFTNTPVPEPTFDAEDRLARETMSTPVVEPLPGAGGTNNNQGQEQSPGRNAFNFRVNDRPWMARVAERRPEGVIRPLETSHLANIGRLNLGLPRELTPTQIWRFYN